MLTSLKKNRGLEVEMREESSIFFLTTTSDSTKGKGRREKREMGCTLYMPLLCHQG